MPSKMELIRDEIEWLLAERNLLSEIDENGDMFASDIEGNRELLLTKKELKRGGIVKLLHDRISDACVLVNASDRLRMRSEEIHGR